MFLQSRYNKAARKFSRLNMFIQKTLLALVIVCYVFTPFATPVFAQAESKQKAMQQKADWTMGIALEQYQRGLYKEAEYSLLKVQDEYAAYMNQDDLEKLSERLKQVRAALSERGKIASYLQASDEFSGNQQFSEAKSRLQEVMGSEFLSNGERKQIEIIIKDLDQKIALQQKQNSENKQKIPEDSVMTQFQQDETEQALTQPWQSPKTPQHLPIQEVQDTSLLPLRQEDTVWKEPAGISVAEQPQQPQEAGYVRMIEQQKNRQRNYTQAIVNDAFSKARDFLLKKEFDKAKQALTRAVSTVQKNKMLLGDELYKEYTGQLALTDEQISKSQSEHIAAEQEAEQKESAQLRK